jgi:formylglycine-generating enzyme required for sulfatase activity
MKTFLTTTFLSLLIFSSFAQQISVKSFRMLESDQEARIISPKKDQNGKKAAIIKVVTSQIGFAFDFGMIGNALATEQKTGELWVWVPAGARKVTINHQQLGVLRNYEFEIDIQEATVYEMILTTGKVTTIVEEEQISTEWVVITSEPTGADVYIDDKATGMQTPYRKQLPMGAHTYRISLDMYYPDVAKFELKPDAGKMKINSILKPAFGQLKLSSTPESGATITLDGKPLSQITPCTIEKIKSGTHSLVVNKALYHDATQNVEIKDELTTTLAIDLKPAYGTITVSSTPESGAAVTLDDVATGKVTPCTIDKVESGNHTVALRREWYAPIKKQITVKDGEKTTVDVPMNQLYGEVKITTTPEADIFIDNAKIATGTYNGRLNEGVYTIEARKPKHTTDLQKIQIETGAIKNLALSPCPQLGILEIDSSPIDAVITLDGINKGTTPTTLRNLLVGDYKISLSLPNYATISKTITITEGQTTKVNETLANGRPVTITSKPTVATLYIDGNKIGTTPYNGNLTFGNHTLRIENDGKKAEKSVSITQTGGETSFSLSFGLQTFTETVKDVSFDMIAVKGGTFSMGSESEENRALPIHYVTLSDFTIGKTEVTQALWTAVMGNNPSNFKGDNLPVETVSWNDCQDFLEKLNYLTGKTYRLPTEAEWEFAARGGVSSHSTIYSGSNNIADVAWYGDNSGSQTQTVAGKKANELGLYDMTGNVWEWCSDWYDTYFGSTQTNPSGASSGTSRSYRGSAWRSRLQICQTTCRNFRPTDYRHTDLGFRLVVSK